MKTGFEFRHDNFAIFAVIAAMLALAFISVFSTGKAAAQPLQNQAIAPRIVKLAPIVVTAKRLAEPARISRAATAKKPVIAS